MTRSIKVGGKVRSTVYGNGVIEDDGHYLVGVRFDSGSYRAYRKDDWTSTLDDDSIEFIEPIKVGDKVTLIDKPWETDVWKGMDRWFKTGIVKTKNTTWKVKNISKGHYIGQYIDCDDSPNKSPWKIPLELLRKVEDEPVVNGTLKCSGEGHGKIGTPTKMKDCDGKPLFVGDVVEGRSPREGRRFIQFVVTDNHDKSYHFVMGIQVACARDGTIHKFLVRKIKDWSTLTDGYRVGLVTAHVDSKPRVNELPDLDKLTPMARGPHPEIKAGTKFVCVKDNLDIKRGETVTLDYNDNTSMPRFKPGGWSLWENFAPLEPTKHRFTGEQVAEAQRIIGEIVAGFKIGECFFLSDESDKEIAIRYSAKTSDIFYAFTAHCSPHDEFNRTIGVLVALCKAVGRKLPDWL